MSRVGLLSLAALLACARAYEDMPAAPQALEPEVVASEGGTATLRCLLHGNPKPTKITWRFRSHTIDGNADRYKLISDGALEINPLYRSDTGVYTCVADNGLGVARQEVHLVVNDESAPHQVVPQKELVASEGGAATLRYLFPGNPPLKITRKFRQHGEHQQRTRHKRQAAGLHLPASHVIPGGEGEGLWGEWGEVSSCSRTCGGGVASQKRICLQSGPEGPQCTGGDTKYFSCQTQDCPEGSGDFRAEQCAEFNEKPFRGLKYNWVPDKRAPNPCKLICRPHGGRFYFRHKLQVTDGTRCNDESFDVCVNGECQPVGCDLMLNSTAREDKCRECGGNGANCRTTNGILDSQSLMKGYNDILLLPAGSTSINIEEVEPSNNYLVLKTKNDTYYLNDHYHIDLPRTIMIAGALWTYERSQQGLAARDKLRSLGPTTEPLYLSLLLQDVNVGIRYEYSVPNNLAPPTDKQYNWVYEEFTPCSATCGRGFQTRNVRCRSREELEIVDASLCDEGLRLHTNQSCSPNPCPAQWVEGPWGECSQICGSGGVKSREVTCQKIIAYGVKSVLPDKECFDLLGPKPEVFQKCNEDAPCPTWFVGHWRPCNKLCGEGKQTRQVACYQKKNGRIKLLANENCPEVKPEEEKPCMLQPCDGIDWVTSSWSGCDPCTSKFRTRAVVCATKSRQVVNESFCSQFNRPADHEECHKDLLRPCKVQWYATKWSKCLGNCGDGVQTRKVFCGRYSDNEEGKNVEEVEDAKCANLTKDHDTRPCTVPKEECSSQWFGGPWSACSEGCRGGEQYRRVMCLRGDKEATDCDRTTVLASVRSCNTGSCNSDAVRMPAGIAGDENATVIGELDSPLHVRCLAYGQPPPCVFWYRDYEEAMALYKDGEHEVRGNDLIFRSLSLNTLGQYSCRAYNGVGKVALWGLVVQAYTPKGLFIDNKWLVPRGATTTTTTEAHRLLFTETSTAGGLTETTEETTELFETSSTNEDAIDVISTTTPGPCSGSEFGCCADNETEASGPDGPGCPCNATEFGSCSDDAVRIPAEINGDENATVIGELDSPLHVRCLAYGQPPPCVFWYRDYEEAMALYNDGEHEVRGNDLIFRNLSIDNLGQYTCRAYNGVGKVASWGVVVRAYKPEGLFMNNEWLVPQGTVAPTSRTQLPINATTTTTTMTTTEAHRLLFTETNEVFECEEYVANCSRLRCEYGIQLARLPDGCEKCSCVQVEIDCESLKQECDQLKCNYAIERVIGTDGCERCKCKEYPCERKSCGAGERCVVHPYMNGLDPEPIFIAECRITVKTGACPMDETTTNKVTCRRECSDDADCRGVGKCCRRGCSDICLVPVEKTSPHPNHNTTIAPNVPAATQALLQQELEVSASEGGTAKLCCPFHGHPSVTITWRFRELTIDGNSGRYRLMSDGALEIVSLYRNDTGVYTCVADNGLGMGLQEVHLAVNVPVSAHVSWPSRALNIGADLHLTCEVDGFPEPDVHWTKDGSTIQTDDRITITGSTIVTRLTVLRVSVADSGLYACHASNPYSSQSDTAQINVQRSVASRVWRPVSSTPRRHDEMTQAPFEMEDF